jgi:hypothetical protein
LNSTSPFTIRFSRAASYTWIGLDEFVHDPLFASCFVYRGAGRLLETAHLEDPLRALVELLENRAVDCVDLLAKAIQLRLPFRGRGFGIRRFRFGHGAPGCDSQSAQTIRPT